MRQIEDTPTSNIASAAQGYVEITGRAGQPGGMPNVSKLTALPCVWFHYEIYEKSSDDKKSLLESGDGRLSLVSNYLPGELRKMYRIWSWVHTCIFVGAGGFAFALV